MARTISYADAVRILGGGPESAVFQRVNTMTGGLLAGAAVAAPQLLALLDLRTELARVSGELVNTAARAMTGSGRRDRTDRLAAAHTIIVIAAYFDAIADVDLSWARLTRQDQFRLAGAGADGARDLTAAALRTGIPVPEPHIPNEKYLAALDEFYDRLTAGLGRFLSGLAPFDDLSEGERGILLRDIRAGGRRARRRYEEMLLSLMSECPDMALWIDHRHRNAIEGRLDSLEPSLRELERLLREVAAENTAEGVAKALQRAHAALLEHRIVESVDLPGGLDAPSLERGYIPPAFQVAERADGGSPASPADEAFWRTAGVRQDIDRFLAGYLGSPRALRAPMLVLGQPGAGKSVLTRILAARLSTTRFLPIRVPLRDVDSTLPMQQQIEQAVLAATTEETTWPALARSIDAVPVIIFDGFDELLQATGVSQDDYLQKAAEFQQREREQGRAAAVIVTSRISVADRATLPPETMLLRLQPFDEPRIRGWVDAWNEVNTVHLAADDMLAHGDLAGQPLLLLMLALNDALRNGPSFGLTTGELYEQLLIGFTRREVGKAYPHLPAAAQETLAEQELSRLAVVAFAMLNRSAQWVTEEAVGEDLRATLGDPAPGRAPAVSAGALTESELIFGRFFFVHRAQAVRGANTRRTYEFLHSTFGEYLVARFTWRLLAEAVARDAVTFAARPMTGNDLLADLLSAVSLTVRASIVQFLAEMAGRLAPDERERWTDVIVRRFRQCERDGVWPASAYRPAPGLNVAARFAAYTANLMLLAVVTSGGLRFGELAEPGRFGPFRQWHDHAQLWHGQLDFDGASALVSTIVVAKCTGPDGRDVRLTLDDGTFRTPRIDPHFLFEQPESTRGQASVVDWMELEARRRRLLFQSCMNNDLAWHALEPLLDSRLGPTAKMYALWWADGSPSAAQALIAVWLLPASGADPGETYRRCVRIAVEFPGWEPELQIAYADQLLRTLAGHHDCPTETAVDVLGGLSAASPDEWLRTAAAVLDRAEHDDPNAAWLANSVLGVITDGWSSLTDRRGAILAAARAVALLERRRRVPDVLGKLGRSRPAGGDEMRGELEAFRVRLASLRTTNERWRADLNALFDEYSWLAAGSDQLHGSLVALARMPGMVGDIETVLAYVDERIANWLVGNP